MTECKSNNSRDLYLSLVNLIRSWKIQGRLIQVVHPEFGVLFSAMIEGEGKLVTNLDEKGRYLPFMTTDEILKQLAKFGFYIRYDVKSNLPDETFVFLQQISLLGYEKITKVMLQTTNKEGDTIWQPSIVVFKCVDDNVDLMSYGQKLSRSKYIRKVDKNIILNVTDQEGISWDWVTSYFNISDILNENLDSGVAYPVENEVDVPKYVSDSYFIPDPSCPAGFTPYNDPDAYIEGDDDGNQ